MVEGYKSGRTCREGTITGLAGGPAEAYLQGYRDGMADGAHAAELANDEPVGKKYDAGKSPVVRGCLHYFPDALRAVAWVSAYGAKKYKVPFEEKNWQLIDDAKGRFMDADGRHLLEEADHPYDPESGLLHAAHHAWNALARLQLMLAEGIPLVDPERDI